MYRVVYEKNAARDIGKLKAVGLDKKVKEIIEIMREKPFLTSPPYKELTGILRGCQSRRISFQHRLVYQVCSTPGVVDGAEYEGVIKIIRMWTDVAYVKQNK